MNNREEISILFVDDETDILQSLQRFLRRERYQKHFVDNGRAALDLLAGTQVDIVVSDLRMPVMNGIELIKEVKRLYPDTVRMIVSGSQDIEQIIESINKGEVFRFIPKPVDPEAFKAILHDAIDYYCMKIERQELFEEISHKNQQLTDANASLKKLASELQRSEEQFRSMNEAAQDAVFMLDEKGVIRYRNTAAETIFGYERGCCPEQLISEIFPLTGDGVALSDLTVTPADTDDDNCRNFIGQLEGVRMDGSRLPLEVSKGCVRLESGPHSVLIARDITTRIEEEKSRAQYETMQKELESQIEKKLLQSQVPSALQALEISQLMLSSGHLDGDFTELIEYNPWQADMLIGDVMGHGIQSALVGAGMKALFLKAVAEQRSSADVLPPLEEIVKLIHQRCIHELIELELFATMLFLRIDLKQRHGSFVDCGHNPILHLPASSGRCEQLKGSNLPIGMTEKDEYRKQAFPLDSGDLLVLYSDGIVESRSPDGEFFGIERFMALLEAHAGLPTEEIIGAIQRTLVEFCNSSAFEDDVTCIVIRLLDERAGGEVNA